MSIIADIVKKALIEEKENSDQIITNNEYDWDQMAIDNDNPGSFENEELTDGESVNKVIDDIPTKKDKEDNCTCGNEPCTCNQNKELVPSDESVSLHEATMSDIPHEIDDKIHDLGDMRFDLEQTRKNWDLSGVELEPLDDILEKIDDLVQNMYDNGALLADDTVGEEGSDKEDEEDTETEEEDVEETEEKDSEEESDEESEDEEEDDKEKEESAFSKMINNVLTEMAE